MLTIHKFKIPIEDEFSISLPVGSRILSVQTQGEEPVVWVLVHTEAPLMFRRFHLRGTGQDCTGLGGVAYVGTFQLRGGKAVFHLFAEEEAP